MSELKKHDFYITYVKQNGNEIIEIKDINVSVYTRYKRITSAKYAISKGLFELGKGWDYYMWS